MSQAFTQQWIKEFQLIDLSPEQFIDIAIQTSRNLGWAVATTSENGFTAYTNNGLFNWNAEVKLNVTNGKAKFLSQSRNIRSIEPGKDKMNLDNFIMKFEETKKAVTAIEIETDFISVQSQVA